MSQTPKTREEIRALVAELPTFSRLVHEAINLGLYAEGSFSDLEAVEVAKMIGCKVEAVNAAIGKLEAVDLVWSEDDNDHLDGAPVFLNSTEHQLFADEDRTWKETTQARFDEARDAYVASSSHSRACLAEGETQDCPVCSIVNAKTKEV